MVSWFERFLGAGRASPLAQRLHGYPPFEQPHAGPPDRWTLAQAQQNLESLLMQRERRLQLLDQLLATQHIDIQPALLGGEYHALLRALHHWAEAQWPALYDRRSIARARAFSSDRRGPDIVYSMLMDVALLLGELVVRRRPSFRWALDLDEQNGRDGMATYRRPVLVSHREGARPLQVEIDLESIVLGWFAQLGTGSPVLAVDWLRVVDDAVSGACEREL